MAIVDAFLDWCHNHRARDTYEWYRYRLQRFAETYPDLTTRDLRPYHVQQWLDQLEGLSSGSKRNYCRAIKRALHWALQQGYIEHDPIAHVQQPKGGKREVVIRQEEFDEILEFVPDRGFRDLLLVTWETGCRPQESLRVEARHVDLVNSRWVFPETEGKCGTLRIVYLTDEALAITKRLVLQHPEGKLFRNSTGRPWTTDAVNNSFVRLQIRLGQAARKEQQLDIDDERRASVRSQTCSRVCGRRSEGCEEQEVPFLRGQAQAQQPTRLSAGSEVLALHTSPFLGDACT